MSIQTAGLYYGNWLSQDAVRGSTGGHDAAHSILLGNVSCCSAAKAARHFGLRVSEWKDQEAPQPQSSAFVDWMKAGVDAEEPVIFGVYMTALKDLDYDHIVPLVGYDEDALYFNDLYFNSTLRAPLNTFVHSRSECAGVGKHVGASSYCLPDAIDYGIRVMGNVDPHGELLPVRLAMSANSEPDYSVEDKRHMAPAMLHGNITMSGLSPGAMYALLQYSDIAALPRDGQFLEKFLADGKQPIYFSAPANGIYQTEVEFFSNSTQFFRCVQANATSLGMVKGPTRTTIV